MRQYISIVVSGQHKVSHESTEEDASSRPTIFQMDGEHESKALHAEWRRGLALTV